MGLLTGLNGFKVLQPEAALHLRYDRSHDLFAGMSEPVCSLLNGDFLVCGTIANALICLGLIFGRFAGIRRLFSFLGPLPNLGAPRSNRGGITIFQKCQTSSFSRSGVTTRGLARTEGTIEGVLITFFGVGALRPSMLRMRSETRGRKRLARKGMSTAP